MCVWTLYLLTLSGEDVTNLFIEPEALPDPIATA